MTAAAVLSFVALAAAHPAPRPLPIGVAQDRAQREAERLALVFAPSVPQATVRRRDCARRSWRTVACTASFAFPGDGDCTRLIRVSYRSSSDHRLRVALPGQPKC